MSESLVSKLLTVQKELKAPKNQFNAFGKYSYRSAEDILEAAKPLNVANGLLLNLSDEPVLIGDWHYIKATATITDGENSHTVTAYAREEENKKGMDAMQVTGTASSYARKYALNGLYLIDDTKDADTDEHRKQTTQKSQSNQNRSQGQQRQSSNQSSQNTSANSVSATVKQKNSITSGAKHLAEMRGSHTATVLQEFKVRDLEKLTQDEADDILQQMKTAYTNESQAQTKQEA